MNYIYYLSIMTVETFENKDYQPLYNPHYTIDYLHQGPVEIGDLIEVTENHQDENEITCCYHFCIFNKF